ncbi:MULTISPECIES: FHA domain-containing protein [unclassified Azospirillum]|uniref:FHA domain-containing protein n=1 Tax=unclassified Azospirillum TaxID=2630922 RepID=UPI000B755AE1|nr:MULTISPECIES: FHA domain-containing protein [unclassified Azospirillum]SNS23157.1 FHA domain-containing protein [Azospirillum sp. RU38E]SNS41276.1 FHA domain-containing protein [Azospirillum sp. RU37A]
MAAQIRFQGQSRCIPLSGAGPWMIGRSTQAAIEIHNDPSTSREQAIIYLERGRYLLEPLSPRVPTLLDGRPVSGRLPLTDGSEIRFAGQVLCLDLGGTPTHIVQAPVGVSVPSVNRPVAVPVILHGEIPAIILFFLSVLALVLPVWELQSDRTAQLIRLLDTSTIGPIAYLLPLAYALAVAGRVLAPLRAYAIHFDLLALAGAVASLIISRTEAESIVTEMTSLRQSPLGGFVEFFSNLAGGTLKASLEAGSGLRVLATLILGSSLLVLWELWKRRQMMARL